MNDSDDVDDDARPPPHTKAPRATTHRENLFPVSQLQTPLLPVLRRRRRRLHVVASRDAYPHSHAHTRTHTQARARAARTHARLSTCTVVAPQTVMPARAHTRTHPSPFSPPTFHSQQLALGTHIRHTHTRFGFLASPFLQVSSSLSLRERESERERGLPLCFAHARRRRPPRVLPPIPVPTSHETKAWCGGGDIRWL